MKNSKRTLVLSSVVLAVGLAVPVASFASVEAAIERLRQSNISKFDQLKDSNASEINNNTSTLDGRLEQIRAEVAKAGNYSRKDVAAAIINYEAEARLKEYQLNEKLRFMNAPGVLWALTAGKQVGEAKVEEREKQLVDHAFQQQMGDYWPTPEQQEKHNTILGNLALETPKSAAQIRFEEFILGLEGPSSLNMGEVIRTNKTTEELAKQFMATVIGPDVEINKGTAEKLEKYKNMTLDEFQALSADEKLSVTDQETVADAMVNAVNMSPSTNILSGILSRRILSPEDEESGNADAKTVMESIEKYANDRFQNPEWYAQVGKSSDTALLREMNHMMAYNIWIQFQAFKLQEQEAAAMAILNANAARLYVVMKDFTDQMNDEDSEIRKAASEAEKNMKKAAKEAEKAAEEAAE
tara:strand:+ start:133453 stop:134688 length:1236 start_codon:yes stop_codon:yes gene_type:complete